MDSIRSKAGRLPQNGGLLVLAVAALCLALAFAVYQITTSQVNHSYASIYPGNPIPMHQRILLAFDGAGEELEDKMGEFPVNVKADGKNEIIVLDGGTVRDALKAAGVELGPHDTVSPALDEALREFDEIVVLRRERQTFTVEEEIPYEVHYAYSPSVRAGEERVETPGQPGRRVELYEQFLVSGEVQEEVLLEQSVVAEPIHELVLMGFRSKPVSGLDFEATFGEDGEPLAYTQVLRGQRATGYTAGAGAATASGRAAQVGHVAVNPNVIPYGSKLFIQSPDGSFIYGYAIAADTGSALMQGAVGVDLYYGSYAESAANGVREVDIFILED